MLNELDLSVNVYLKINDIYEPLNKNDFEKVKDKNEINIKILRHLSSSKVKNFSFIPNSNELNKRVKSFNKNMKKDKNFSISFPLFYEIFLKDEKMGYAIPASLHMVISVNKINKTIICNFKIIKDPFSIGTGFMRTELQDFFENESFGVKKFKKDYEVNISEKFKKFDLLLIHFLSLFFKDINTNLFIDFMDKKEYEFVRRVDVRNLHRYLIRDEKDHRNLLINNQFE